MAAVSQEAAFYIRSLHPDPPLPLPLPLLILLLRSWICRCCRGDTLEVLCFDVERREAGTFASASEQESLSGVLQVDTKLNHSAFFFSGFFLFFSRKKKPLNKSAPLLRRLISQSDYGFTVSTHFKGVFFFPNRSWFSWDEASFSGIVNSHHLIRCAAAAVCVADRAMALGGLPGSNADL